MDNELNDLKVSNRKGFVKFMELLHADFLKNGKNWQNNTLDNFLEAITAYAEDIQGLYNNRENGKDADTPDWQTFADILRGAVIYE